MPIEFIQCRRTDDHSVTSPIAVSALPHLTGWEPIPGAEGADTAAKQPGDAQPPDGGDRQEGDGEPAPEPPPPAEPAPGPEADKPSEPAPKTQRRSRAASTDKE